MILTQRLSEVPEGQKEDNDEEKVESKEAVHDEKKKQTKLISDDAIEWCARKMASSGDIRQCFQICR
jgi:Cdc6-like AAA superfamily ATPase